MWLRDYLPRDAPNARILTYGYYSKLQDGTAVNILQDHTNKFVHGLMDMREEGQCDSRPIIFIGHSLGCLIIKKTLTDAVSLGINSSRIPVREIIFLAAPHRGLNITALQTLVRGKATEQMVLELKSESPTLTWLNQGFTRFARDIDILTCYETKPTKTAIDVDGVWAREGPPIMMVSRDSAQQFYPREKLVSADCDHSQIAKIKRGQNGIYPAVKSAVKHGLVSTAKIVAGAGAVMNESSRFESKLQDLHIGLDQSSPPPYPPRNRNDSEIKGSAIEPVTKAPLAFRAALDPVQEPSITLEDLHTSTTATSLKDDSPPCTLESENAGDIIGSPIQLQEQIVPSHAAVVEEANATSLIEEEKTTTLAKLDDDLKAMMQEFDEDLGYSQKNAQGVTCRLCTTGITAFDYHYTCPECIPESFDCEECYLKLENCRIHHKKLMKLEFKPWNTGYGIVCVDIIVTTEDNELIRALKENDIIGIKRYAQNRSLLDSQDQRGLTPLHVAAHLGLEEGTALLIEYGALLEARNRLDYTPLHTAIDANQIQIIQILLDNGANIEATLGEIDGSTPLYFAVKNAMHHIATLLLRRGAEVDALNQYGTVLHMTLRQERFYKCVEPLLAAGAKVNIKGSGDSDTPLHSACGMKDHETAHIVVGLLLRYSAKVNVTNYGGYSPLMIAASQGHLGACKSLLERRPQLDIKSNGLKGVSAVYFAARGGHEEVLDLLIAKGASCFPPRMAMVVMGGELPILETKWRSLEFSPGVTAASKQRILKKLRAGKHK
ncbi:hypothetical protein V500_08165 [Pseudogymnoascus sp. VKM F-4518 (FW-2643)]|nr:hypothetical protein V500_08165 [Pseudogymnoascus sp. VKM F-4518 (FW-2643)]